jgi:hypothetical protein
MALIKKAKPADAIEEIEEMDAASGEDVAATADEAAIEEPAAEPAEAPAANDSNALLNMFTEVGIETVDRSLLTGLAGEVDMVDLISELHLVAAAMGIVRSQQETAAPEEQLAA